MVSETARDLIFQTLKSQNKTDRECLNACGIQTSFLSDWKTGKLKTPGFDKVYRIFKYLGLSLDDMEEMKEEVALDMDTSNLLDRVKATVLQAIEAKGISKAECARASNISPTFFTEWESGKVKTPGFDKIFRIFQYLGLSLDTLAPLGQESMPEEPSCLNLAADEKEILRLFQMQDMEGRTEILHAAYVQKRRLASDTVCLSSFGMVEQVRNILNNDDSYKRDILKSDDCDSEDTEKKDTKKKEG